MKDFNFKYYPARILIFLFCVIIAIIIIVKGFLHPVPSFWTTIFWITGSSSVVALAFSLFNKYAINYYVFKLLDLPDIRGTYLGDLISSNSTTKFVKLIISQNINGFYVEAQFFDNQYVNNCTSFSESITHDILKKENDEFIISYLYRNKVDRFHKDYKNNPLCDHSGMCSLTFNEKNKTLIGEYFNDGKQRMSYGKLNLKKI